MSKINFNTLPANIKQFYIKDTLMLGNIETSKLVMLDELDKEVFENICLENEDFYPDKQEELLQLLLNELDLIKVVPENKPKVTVKTAYFHITSHCNLHCTGCYSNEDMRNCVPHLTLEQAIKIANNLHKSGVEEIVFSGGEPFLYPYFKELLSFIKNNLNINILVISNGTLDFSKYEPCLPYINQLAFSIDGYNEQISFLRDKGIFGKIVENVKKVKQTDQILTLIVTLHKENYKHLAEYNKLSIQYKVPMSLSFYTVNIKENADDKFIMSYKEINELQNISTMPLMDTPFESGVGCCTKCVAGKELVSISSTGDIYPCHALQQTHLKMGNALTDDISTIVNKEVFNKQAISGIEVDQISGCGDCEYKYICGGGCRYRGYAYTNSLTGKDPLCNLFKTEYQNYF